MAVLLARISGRLAIISLLGAGGVLLVAVPLVDRGSQLTHNLGHWAPVGGTALGIAFSADARGLTYALAVALAGVLVLVFTLSSQPDLGLGSWAPSPARSCSSRRWVACVGREK